MATAFCLNDDGCDRDSWELTKDPDQYARGGPTCPECGTSRVRIEGADDTQQAQAATPATTEQQQAAPPAQQDQGADQMLSAGMQVGDTLAQMDSRDGPSTGDFLKLVGAAGVQYGNHLTQKEQENRQRAKQTSSDDLQVAEEYPECPDCGTQLTNVPEAREFSCPACGVLLEMA